MVGRPSSYSEETAEAICDRLMQGQSLRSICLDPKMPDVKTVFNWLEKQPSFFQRYTRAREVQGHHQADLAVDDAVVAKDPQLGRLAFDARRWHASKLVPKVYGDKLSADVSVDSGVTIKIVGGLPED
jgi:hypothetical protein